MDTVLLHIIKGGLPICPSGKSSPVVDFFLVRKGFVSQTAILNARELVTAGKKNSNYSGSTC